ncbi:MAG: sigma 54-interacting transcriptional regulator [Kofleriaceae bacterium]|jgi:two-component system response regulator AtoC|nr:sigma 54-interacting transcriptional regulator [Kofleriaceae bacterium]MBP6837086.1 sigma 54-interacting transcriptional regulator [Kofleriaceae bacterium]
MESPPTPPGAAAETAGPDRDRDRDGDYLLCIDGERSWRAILPREGELFIGRGVEAGLRLDDELVSRTHAQLLIVPDGLRLSDLGSRHGTSVNGKRLAGPRLLASGDVISIGRTMLVVHRPTRMAGARALLNERALRARFEEELERALRYQREVSLLVLRAGQPLDHPALAAALTGHLRLIDSAAAVGEQELAILLPEVSLDEALELSQRLLTVLAPLAPGLSAAVATSPADGIDATSLLAATTTCAEAARPGQVVQVRSSARTLVIGSREIALVEPAMVQLYDLARRLARSGMPILIRGETGVGKELAAAAVHAFSERSGRLVSINCAAIPESLAESELFGHERGAFSGAVAAKPGQLELASGGTVFLDEVGDLPLAVQAKLLRVVENQELTRVGDLHPRATDLRIVAATNRDLEADIAAGRFRQDLFFRLAAGQLLLPPLRERPRDLGHLAGQLLADACNQLRRRRLTLSVAALQALLLHHWPGNVRELKHAMAYAAAGAPESSHEVDVWHLPANVTATARLSSEGTSPMVAMNTLGPAGSGAPAGAAISSRVDGFRPIADEVRELERARIVEALIASGGVQNQAAGLIEMPLRTFVTKLKRYGIQPAEWTGARR